MRSLNYRRGFRGYGFNSGQRFQRPQYRYTINCGRGGGAAGNNNNGAGGSSGFASNRGGLSNNNAYNTGRQYNRDNGRFRNNN